MTKEKILKVKVSMKQNFWVERIDFVFYDKDKILILFLLIWSLIKVFNWPSNH